MDSLPLSPTDRPSSLNQLQHIAHYTGTTLRILEDELSIEGYSIPLVELAKRILQFNLQKVRRSIVQQGSVVSTTGSDNVSTPRKPSPSVEFPVECNEEVTSTTEGDDTKLSPSQQDSLSRPKTSQSPSKPSQPATKPYEPEPIPSTSNTAPVIDIFTVPDDEEEMLKQIFYSPATQPASSSYIELKLGKNLTVGPGEERSITLSLKQRLTKKYLLHTHFEFEKYQDKLELVMELINGTNVQLDLKNISNSPVQLKADQNIVIMEERVQSTQEPQRRKPKKTPMLVKKKLPSEGGIKNPAEVNASNSSPPSKPDPRPSDSENTLTRSYNVRLLETIEIPKKSVAYAEVVVEKGDDHVYGKVHEMIRHPDFKSSAIFIPERQRKKICRDKKLHMSIRNRLDEVKILEKGKVVGQIRVETTPSRKREGEIKPEPPVKKPKLNEDSRRSPTEPAKPSAVKDPSKAEKHKILALIKQAISDSPATITATNVKEVAGRKVIEIGDDDIMELDVDR